MDFSRLCYEIWEHHRGKAIGVFIGLLFALAVIKIGFWPTLFMVFCIIVGLLIGCRIDGDIQIEHFFRRFFKD